MRSDVDIDEVLLAQAVAVSGLSKRATVEEALRRLIEEHRRQVIADMTGLGWTGDLDAMRDGRAEPKT